MSVDALASRPRKRILKKTVKFTGVGIGAIVFAYFFSKQTFFHVACGIYDIARNRPLTRFVVRQYFFGNGVTTWLASPLNVLLDILSLPCINKGIYRRSDLPTVYRAKVERLTDEAKRANLVGQLERRTKEFERTMIFF